MKIKHSISSYLCPIAILAILVFACFFYKNPSLDKNRSSLIIGFIVIAALILLYCVRLLSEYLEFDKNTVSGATGIIKRKTMSIPLSNVTSCQYESKGIFNTIKISSATGVFIFSNMSSAKKFVQALNNEIGSIQRNSDTVNAIKEGFSGLKK